MKNIGVLLFALISVLSQLFSFEVERIILGTGNDMWTFGMSRNDDDQLSYSALALIELENSEISFEAQGITNRGYKDGWIPGQSNYSESNYYNGRYDSAILLYKRNIDKFKDNLYGSFNIGIGLQAIGKMGFDFFQNSNHDILKIHGVTIPYDVDKTDLHPYLTVDLEAALCLHAFPSSKLFAGCYIKGFNSIDFQKGMSVGTKLSVVRDSKDILSFSLGMAKTTSKSDLSTANLYSRFLNNAKTNLLIDTGLLTISYEGFLNTGYGFTRIGMNVLPLKDAFNWKRSDFNAMLGMTYMMHDELWTIRASMPIRRTHFSLFIENRNVSGDPIDQRKELTAKIDEQGRLKKQINGIFVGLNTTFKLYFLDLYANLSFGLMDIQFYKLTNTIPSSNYPYINLGKATMYAFDIAYGITLLPESLIINGYANYRVSIEGGVTILTNANDAYDLICKYDSIEKNKLGNVIPKLTVLLNVGLSL